MMDLTIIAAIIGVIAIIIAACIQRSDTGGQRQTRSSDVDNQQTLYSQHNTNSQPKTNYKVKRYWGRGLGVFILCFFLGNIAAIAIRIEDEIASSIASFFVIIPIWTIGLYFTYRVWKG